MNPAKKKKINQREDHLRNLKDNRRNDRFPIEEGKQGTMASDDIVWQIINQQFCSFKLKYIPPNP